MPTETPVGYRRPSRALAMILAAVVVATTAVTLVIAPTKATAADMSGFDPGHIISDALFFEPNAMTVDQIQTFLNQKVPACAGGYVCLKDYRESTYTIPATPMCSAYVGAANETAAQIIFKVGQTCGISSKAILVVLQKEQGLVTKSAPSSGAYRSAMGAGCPDTAACDANYYGFFNQVHYGAYLLKRYTQPAGTGAGTEYTSRFDLSYPVGRTSNILYHPNAACGTKPVTVSNQATHSLYLYTPYTPNPAALASSYGTGDGCSSYGNRNFYSYYSDWFGSPNADSNPIGNIDIVEGKPGAVHLGGWAFDPDTADSIPVHVYINGVGTAITATNSRPDVGATWPAVGSAHGFDATIPISTSGAQSVCIYGINAGPGQNVLFGCRTVSAITGSPTGSLDILSVTPGKVTVGGWVLDPDTAASIPVHVYVDSVGTAFTADDSRSDIASLFPSYGANHGFLRTVDASPGPHTVCVYGIESGGRGANMVLGCRAIVVRTGSPIGVVDSIVAGPGTFTVSGWAFDPDTADSIPVHVYANSTGIAGTADQSRPDVAGAYPGYGALHGYSITVPASPGTNTVCAYGIESHGSGSNQVLACRALAGMSGSPFGSVDVVAAAAGGVYVGGWAVDPDTAASIPVHVYVDSVGVAITANGARPDVSSIYPGYGSPHGFGQIIPAPSGTHNVCLYGIESAGKGSNSLLGCRAVTL